MSAPTKTEVTLLDSNFLGTGGQPLVGTGIDVSGVHTIGVAGFIGRLSSSAHATPWASLVIEGNPTAANNSLWFPISQLIMPAGASIANTTLSGAVSAGATSITVVSGTNISAGDLLFLSHTTDVTKYEVVRVAAISGGTVTIDGSVINAHDSGAQVTDQAERFIIPSLDVTGLSRIRGKLINQSGQSVAGCIIGMTSVL